MFLRLVFALIVFCGVPAMAQDVGIPISTTVIVTYPDSSTRFDPSMEAQMHLEHARDAVIIYVSGRTSTDTPSAKDEALAFKRAAAARAYLIQEGISPLKIMVNYISAADYVADNSTSWGKAANQRVEIEMVFIDSKW